MVNGTTVTPAIATSVFVANTDFGWFSHFLHRAEPPDEVDFWQPSPHGFKAIPPGAPFFFRLGAPHKAIAGCGFFARYERVPVWLAWESFGDLNGTDTFAEMTAHRGNPPPHVERLPRHVRRRIASMRRHLGEGVGAVQVAEGLPGEPNWHALVPREEAEAGDGLVRRAETEEERRARRDRLEAVRRGLPEVGLVRRLRAVQEVREPAKVSVGDESGRGISGAHRASAVDLPRQGAPGRRETRWSLTRAPATSTSYASPARSIGSTSLRNTGDASFSARLASNIALVTAAPSEAI